MVFLHGGGFVSGAGSLYDPRELSEGGPVVVVTLNYRLGALGFLSLPQLDAARPGAPSGSDGIRDQQMALRWVKDNIAAFHGDTGNVTVMGESAGAISACIHLVSPGSQGLAQRFIMESGSCVSPPSVLPSADRARAVASQLLLTLCPALPAGADVLSCLRSVPGPLLTAWLPPPGSDLDASLGSLFFPAIEGVGGGTLPDTPANLIASGSYARDATIIAGTNENEFGLFAEVASNPLFGGAVSSPLNVTTPTQLSAMVAAAFGGLGPAVEAQYPVQGDVGAQETFLTLFTDYDFRCPTRDLARATTAQGSRVFLYSYDVGRAYHTDELLALFSGPDLGAFGGTVPSGAFRRQMQSAWTQFAATGNPGAPWPAYDATTDENLILSDPTPSVGSRLAASNCDFWDSQYAQMSP